MLNWRAFLLTFVLILFTELYLEGTSRFAFGEEVWFRVSTLLCMVLAGSLWQFFSVVRYFRELPPKLRFCAYLL